MLTSHCSICCFYYQIRFGSFFSDNLTICSSRSFPSPLTPPPKGGEGGSSYFPTPSPSLSHTRPSTHLPLSLPLSHFLIFPLSSDSPHPPSPPPSLTASSAFLRLGEGGGGRLFIYRLGCHEPCTFPRACHFIYLLTNDISAIELCGCEYRHLIPGDSPTPGESGFLWF